MRHIAMYVLAGALSLMAAGEALARTVVITNVNLRAGPDVDYPTIIRLNRNSVVDVYGCIDDWYWCDVSVGHYRGWVRSDYIRTRYNRRDVAFIEAAPHLHVPIVSFNIGYWDKHYRGRPFYRDRDRWERHGYRDRDNHWHNRYNWRGRGDRHDSGRDDDRRRRGNDRDNRGGRWHH